MAPPPRELLATTALVGVCIAVPISVAHAGSNLPTGGQVIGGSATISQTSATQMQITSTTARSAISWQDFSIGSGYGVNVTQPNGGTQLEQVRGTNVSQIFGALTSNGKIVIANPNGIWFGANAQVDVAGLTATTAHATATDIQSFVNGGSLALSQAGNANAAVVNQGTITISNAGLAAFVAPGVRNDGVIQARLGTVQLSSGTAATLDFYGDGLVSIAVSGQTLAQAIDPSTGKALGAAVTNTGTLNADGGTVLVTANVASNVVNDAINTSGVIQAQSVSEQNGQIVLDGGPSGAVQVAGSLDASGTGAGQTGGTVKVLGNQVALNAGATVNVAGDAGGGTAAIGGDFHGAGPDRNAQATYVDQAASIDADAITSGNGGTVAVWSDQATTFNGAITARGGGSSGNGGFVETSGHQLSIGDGASTNTTAPAGQMGTWLLDPADITISSAACSGMSPNCTSGGGGPYTWVPSSGVNTSTVNVTNLVTALNKNNVTIDTTNTGTAGSGTGNITVGAAISWAANSTLTLTADNNIAINASISDTTAGGGLTLKAGNSISFGGSSATINLTNGAFTATINDMSVNAPNRGTSLAVFDDSAGAAITTGGGAITIVGCGASGGSCTAGGYGSGSTYYVGNISLNGALTTTGGSNLAGGAVTITNPVGNITGSPAITANGGTSSGNANGRNAGNVSVTATSGSVTLGAIGAVGSAGAGTGNRLGGTGGTVSVTGGTMVGVGAITTSGGTAVGTSAGGNAGSITLAASGITLGGNLTAQGGSGSSGTNPRGSGGTVNLTGTVTLSPASVTIESRRGATGTGATDGAVSLGSSTGSTLAVSAGTAGVTFNGLTLSALNLANSTGTETLNAGTYNIGSADVFGWNGSATMPTTTNGTLTLSQGTTFSGAVTLGSDTTLSGGSNAITFGNTVNGGNALTINTSGATTFGGAVGATTALAGLTTDAGGTTVINTTTIKTSGTQTYNDSVTLGANATLTGTTVSFGTGSTVDAATVGGDSLTVTGAASFGGAVGGTTALSSLGVTGATALNGGTVTTTAGQSYGGAVTLGSDTTLTSTAAGAIAFNSTLAGGGHSLSAISNSAPSFNGGAGSVTNLANVTLAPYTNGGTISVGDNGTINPSTVTYDFRTAGLTNLQSGISNLLTIGSGTAGNIAIYTFSPSVNVKAISGEGNVQFYGNFNGAGSLDLTGTGGSSGTAGITDGYNVTTVRGQTYNSAVTLANNVVLANTGSGSLTFSNTVSGPSYSLTVTTGAATFGNTVNVKALTTQAATLDNNVTTSGGQTYSGAVTLGSTVTLTDSSATGITFAGTVDDQSAGAQALTVNNTGTGATTFKGNVGAAAALASLAAYGPVTFSAAGGGITTTGTTGQEYFNAVTVGANTQLTNTGHAQIKFRGTVNSDGLGTPRDLTATTDGWTVFENTVGVGAPLHTLVVTTGPAEVAGGTVKTTGGQTYAGNDGAGSGLKIDANTTLIDTGGSNIVFGSTINGAYALTVETTGSTTFAGTVGNLTPLAGLTVDTGKFINNYGGGVFTLAPGDSWQIWSQHQASDSLNGLQYAFKQFGATFGSSSVLGTGNGYLLNEAPTVTVSLTASDKPYDGTNAAASPVLTPSDPGMGDTINASATSITFSDKNAANGKTVTATGMSLSATNTTGACASSPCTVYGYTLASTTATTIANITPAPLTVGGAFTAADKTYNRDVTATINPGDTLGLVGVYAGDTVSLNKAAQFADWNVGVGKSVSLTGSTLGGADAGNYTLSLAGAPTTTASINAAPLTITADDKSKTFGSVNPPLTASYIGLVGGDTSGVVTGLALATTATTTSAVGTYPITASGGTAANYTISYGPDGVLTITTTSTTSAPFDQTTRQGQNPGNLNQFVSGPSLGGNLGGAGPSAGGGVPPLAGELAGISPEAGPETIGEELAAINPAAGGGPTIEDLFAYFNRFLSGADLGSAGACDAPGAPADICGHSSARGPLH